MAHTAHLYRVGETWYFRVRFPADLKSHFKRDEFKRTLKTKTLTSAKQLLKLWAAETERIFTVIRTGMLTDAQVKQLVEGYVGYALKKNDAERLESGVSTTILDTEEGPVELPERYFSNPESDHILTELEANRFDHVSRCLDEFLATVSVDVDKESPAYKRICRDVALAHINKIHVIDCQRDMNDFSDPYYSPKGQQEAEPVQRPETVEPKSLLLSELIQKYVKEHTAQGKWTAKSHNQTATRLSLILEIIGERPIDSITRDDVVNCLDKLQRLPSNKSKKVAYRDKSIQELLELESIEAPLGVTTVKHHMQMLSSLLKWATILGYLNRNVAEGVVPRDNRSASEQRNEYTRENLQKIYNFFVEAPRKISSHLHISEEEKWIPLIGMYSGMRLNEICQLYNGDVKEVDGVWCFEINELEDKKAKTQSGKRIVPVHPHLIEVGFLDYHKSGRHDRLFPSLKKGRDGYSDAFGKKFQRLNRAFITAEKDQVFHSLRHSFTNALKQAGVGEQLIAELVGHSQDSITMERYGKRYQPKVLLEVVLKLDYGIDL